MNVIIEQIIYVIPIISECKDISPERQVSACKRIRLSHVVSTASKPGSHRALSHAGDSDQRAESLLPHFIDKEAEAHRVEEISPSLPHRALPWPFHS